MTNARPLIAWDSGIVIAAIGKKKPMFKSMWPHIEPMYLDAEQKKTRLLISEVVVAEVIPSKNPEESDAISAFFDSEFIRRRPVDDRVSELAVSLRKKHSLGGCDALIVATALVHKAKQLYTLDGKPQKGQPPSKMLALNGKVPDLEILEPNAFAYAKMELWMEAQ